MTLSLIMGRLANNEERYRFDNTRDNESDQSKVVDLAALLFAFDGTRLELNRED